MKFNSAFRSSRFIDVFYPKQRTQWLVSDLVKFLFMTVCLYGIVSLENGLTEID